MSEKKVYSAITKAMAQIAKSGISKDRKNQQQGYSFRGIDDVYNALSGVLSDNGLVILPRVLSREVTERQTKGGSALFYVVLAVEFDIVCSEDGSSHTVKTYGEAMDSADKATNKAMSAAYKYMAMEVFCIPTEGDNDADAHTHEVKPVTRPITPNDAGKDFWNSAEGDEKSFLVDCLSSVREALETSPERASQAFYSGLQMDMEEQAAVWSQLNSKERAAIKSFKPVKEAA